MLRSLDVRSSWRLYCQAPLSQVPDMPTAVLMTAFYRELQKDGDKARALQAAMLSVKVSHPDPKNWAGFVLIGQPN
ncbi:MAG: CHAT domain-containing protein [Cyanobacteria bacterium J06632_22]